MTIRYPRLVAAVDGWDIDDLAGRAGLPAKKVRAWLITDVDVPPVAEVRLRAQLADVLGLDADWLFRLRDSLDTGLPTGERRYATDPDLLRAVEGRRL